MKLKNRWMRCGVAVAIVGLIATQIPYTSTKAAIAADYPNTGGDDSGNFLGFKGLKTRDVIEGVVAGTVVYGVVVATTGSVAGGGEAGATTAGNAGGSGGDGDLIGGGKKKKKNSEPTPSPTPTGGTTSGSGTPASL